LSVNVFIICSNKRTCLHLLVGFVNNTFSQITLKRLVSLHATGRATTGAKRKSDPVKRVLAGTCSLPCLSELLSVKPGQTSSPKDTLSFFLGPKSNKFFKDHADVFKAAYDEQKIEFGVAAENADKLASAERAASPVQSSVKRRRGAGAK
jgi:hypothetical protein